LYPQIAEERKAKIESMNANATARFLPSMRDFYPFDRPQ
jgi:hypothetical protein